MDGNKVCRQKNIQSYEPKTICAWSLDQRGARERKRDRLKEREKERDNRRTDILLPLTRWYLQSRDVVGRA